MIKQLNDYADAIQSKQVQVSNQIFWETSSLAQHITSSPDLGQRIAKSASELQKKASKSQKKTSSLLKFADSDKDSQKKEEKDKKKISKKLIDFL